jgi:hypothetical protein
MDERDREIGCITLRYCAGALGEPGRGLTGLAVTCPVLVFGVGHTGYRGLRTADQVTRQSQSPNARDWARGFTGDLTPGSA